MTVSVLIPVYGVEKYIAECAESLFTQTYREIEYLFCDDCTPDQSIQRLKEVMDKYPERKEHIHIIQNEKNRGIGGTRTHLLSKVQTDCFAFVDSDDTLPPSAIELLVRKMEATKADITEGAFAFYTNGKTTATSLPNHDSTEKYRKKVQVCDLIRHQLWGKLYKTEVTRLVPQLFMDGIDMAEDYCATTRLAAVTTRAWTDEVVYNYRVEQQSFFIKEMSEKNIISCIRATRTVLDFYRQRGPLSLSVEIGILRAYRQAHREKGMTIQMVDDMLRYTPQHLLAKILFKLLASNHLHFSFVNLIYKIIRQWAIRC